MSAYDDLVARLKRIDALSGAASVLHWDQETYMPSAGVAARSTQLATLSATAHEWFTDETFGRLLKAAEAEASGDDQAAVLRETRWAFERATRVPTSLVEEMSRATSEALPVWAAARDKGDFAHFRPMLTRLVGLRGRYAEAVDSDRAPYEVLFGDYEPWIPLETATEVLRELRNGLEPIIKRALASSKELPPVPPGPWDAGLQAQLNERVLDLLGYDRTRGRLDRSAHPFSMGNVHDTRITTRYDFDDPLNALSSTIHEFGHALYTLGLPAQHHGTPICEARDLVVHESQSRFWENHIGRRREFLAHVVPLLHAVFGDRAKSIDVDTAWRRENHVSAGLIRVDADELTYHMHVALRTEIETALFDERLQVNEIPQAWNEGMQAELGRTPEHDGVGCLQDIHWAHGSFGYFPTYSLGSALAAQLAASFEADQGPIAERLAANDIGSIRTWLRDRVHQHGKRFKTPDLIQMATGAPLRPDAFLAHAKAKADAL